MPNTAASFETKTPSPYRVALLRQNALASVFQGMTLVLDVDGVTRARGSIPNQSAGCTVRSRPDGTAVTCLVTACGGQHGSGGRIYDEHDSVDIACAWAMRMTRGLDHQFVRQDKRSTSLAVPA